MTTQNNEIRDSRNGQCCVLVICGIPGSGKSTLAKLLQKKWEEESLKCHVLSFDDYEVNSSLWDSESFARSREAGLSALGETLIRKKYDIIVVDDIMFYYSMRRKVYQLARLHRASYAVLHVDLPIEEARRRNASRPDVSRVKDESVTRIIELFEAPGSSNEAGWERAWLKTSGCIGDSDVDGDDVYKKVKALIRRAEETSILRERELKQEAFKEQQKEESLTEREKWSQAQSDGYCSEPLPVALLLQTLDLRIRNVTSHIMKKCSQHKLDMKEVSRLVSRFKKDTLTHTRLSLESSEKFYSVQKFLEIYFFGYYKKLMLGPSSAGEIDVGGDRLDICTDDIVKSYTMQYFDSIFSEMEVKE